MDLQPAGVSPVKLLVVEDSEAIRLTIVDHLRDEGYLVSEARDGAEALEVFDRLGADLILMDIQMPVMNGIDAAHELHKRDISLPIFAFTAAPDSIEGSRHLFAALIVKPMRPSKLSEALEAYFKAHPRH